MSNHIHKPQRSCVNCGNRQGPWRLNGEIDAYGAERVVCAAGHGCARRTKGDYTPRYGDIVRIGTGRTLWEVGVVNDKIQLLHDRRRADNDLGITYRYLPVRDSNRLTLVQAAKGGAR